MRDDRNGSGAIVGSGPINEDSYMCGADRYRIMSWATDVVDVLAANEIRTVAYLPDTAITPVIEAVERQEEVTAIRLSREEAGIGVLSGAWLGHERGALLCQSSGLATTINALASLSKPASTLFPYTTLFRSRKSVV